MFKEISEIETILQNKELGWESLDNLFIDCILHCANTHCLEKERFLKLSLEIIKRQNELRTNDGWKSSQEVF
jgi:hypothetical protein